MSDMGLSVSGLASGFDWKSLVDQLIELERQPQVRLRTEQTGIGERNNAYGSIKTQLGVLQTRVNALKDTSLYTSRLATTGDSTVATAAAEAGAPLGAYTFSFSQLATAAALQGAADAGKAIADTDDVSAVVLSSAGFTTAPTAGTFTVNGKQVTIATSDTLQEVFDKISTATSGSVTGSYSAATDKITLASGGEVVLGSVTDTSNFLQVAKLNNNGTGTVSSSYSLGGVRLTGALSSANLETTISDGGAGAGEFKINGVSITFSTSADSVQTVLDRINNSTAGVTATYDTVNDRFLLTNQSTGDVGIALEDVTGNFLAATKLSGGSLQRGKNLLYTVNGGAQLVSQSNTATGASSGLAGLSVTALKEGASATITVSSDTAKVKSAIEDFLAEYNAVQSMIDTQTASTTDSSGKVTAGTLAGELDAYNLASQLRQLAYSPVSGLTGVLTHLEALGIVSSGDDNSLTLEDSEKLDDALANNMSGIQALFADGTNGIAVQFGSYIDDTIGEEGTLVAKQSNLTKQSSDIDTQISDLERLVLATRERLTASFIAMETAQAKINQQLQFLQQRFGASS